MKSYIFSILIISVIGGIASNLLSEHSEKMRKHINFIIGLICAICLISPITSAVSNATDLKNTLTGYIEGIVTNDKINASNSLIINSGVEKVCDSVKESVVNKFKLNENDVIVEAVANTENIQSIYISQINVTLTGKASWSDVDKVKEYLVNLIGCDVTVKRK